MKICHEFDECYRRFPRIAEPYDEDDVAEIPDELWDRWVKASAEYDAVLAELDRLFPLPRRE